MRRSATKAPLTATVLRRTSKAATAAASKRAFKQVETLLVVKDGWLVRVNSSGKVVKHVRRVRVPSVA